MYSEKLSNKYETWLENALEEKKGYILIKDTQHIMVFMCGKSVEPIHTMYVLLRMEDGTEEKLIYDTHSSDTAQPIEKFNLLIKDR